jgi:hypothetical protein
MMPGARHQAKQFPDKSARNKCRAMSYSGHFPPLLIGGMSGTPAVGLISHPDAS